MELRQVESSVDGELKQTVIETEKKWYKVNANGDDLDVMQIKDKWKIFPLWSYAGWQQHSNKEFDTAENAIAFIKMVSGDAKTTVETHTTPIQQGKLSPLIVTAHNDENGNGNAGLLFTIKKVKHLWRIFEVDVDGNETEFLRGKSPDGYYFPQQAFKHFKGAKLKKGSWKVKEGKDFSDELRQLKEYVERSEREKEPSTVKPFGTNKSTVNQTDSNECKDTIQQQSTLDV